MNKRTKLLVASIGACTLLVGGTFAAWAVTDNADPFSIRVSTSEIQSDTTNYVTLEWGQNASANIGALKMGEKRLAAAVELKATVATKEAYVGKFSYTIKQTNNLEAANRLIDKLVVDVYEANDVTGDVGDVATIGEDKEAVAMTPIALKVEDNVATKGGYKNVQVLSGEDLSATKTYKVVLSLGDLNDTVVYDALANDVVNIEFDWGMKDGEDVVTSRQYYVKGLGGQAYAYAWHGEKKNAAWPGVKMEAVSGETDIYTISLGSEYDNIIFATGSYEGENFNTSKQTVNLVPETAKDLFTLGAADEEGKYAGAWSVFEPTPAVEPGFYLMGENLYLGTDAETGKAVEWNTKEDTKLALVEDACEFSVYTPGNAKLKVYESSTGTWYGEESTEGADFTLGDAGVYTMHFYKNKNGEGKYITAAKAEVPEEPGKTFADFKLVYGLTDEDDTWGYAAGLAGEDLAADDEAVEAQLHFTKEFAVNEVFKLWDGTPSDHYYGAYYLETGVEGFEHETPEQKANHVDNNVKCTAAGTYDIYFKHWKDGGYSIYAGLKA